MPLPTDAFPPTTASRSTDCELPHCFLHFCGPWTSTQPLDAAQKMDLKYGPRWQHGPQIFSWLPATAWTLDINTAKSYSVNHRYGHGLWWQQRPQTSAWSPVAALIMDVSMVSEGSTDHRHQQGSRSQTSLYYFKMFAHWDCTLTSGTGSKSSASHLRPEDEFSGSSSFSIYLFF